jgi:hypothetical protein
MSPILDDMPEPEGATDFEKLFALGQEWRANPGEDEDAILAELERAFEEEPLQFGDIDLSDWLEGDE